MNPTKWAAETQAIYDKVVGIVAAKFGADSIHYDLIANDPDIKAIIFEGAPRKLEKGWIPKWGLIVGPTATPRAPTPKAPTPQAPQTTYTREQARDALREAFARFRAANPDQFVV